MTASTNAGLALMLFKFPGHSEKLNWIGANTEGNLINGSPRVKTAKGTRGCSLVAVITVRVRIGFGCIHFHVLH